MNDSELLRYARHILLDDIGIEGQARLLASRVLIIGAGGLGSPAALYLASAGCGHITLVDHDAVEATNLQRQIAHTEARLGQPKVNSMAEAMTQINPGITVVALQRRADDALLDELVAQADVVLDCTDNFGTRHAINRACVAHGKPLVSGSALQMDGQVCVFNAGPDAPCYACLFPESEAPAEADCATMGVLAPLVGIIGSIQATEALKLLASFGQPLGGRLLMLDGRQMAFTEVRARRHAACAVCAPKDGTEEAPL
ncbi:MAG: HesA/MoeB/ThiF family protein [Pseudomonadota bacterium]